MFEGHSIAPFEHNFMPFEHNFLPFEHIIKPFKYSQPLRPQSLFHQPSLPSATVTLSSALTPFGHGHPFISPHSLRPHPAPSNASHIFRTQAVHSFICQYLRTGMTPVWMTYIIHVYCFVEAFMESLSLLGSKKVDATAVCFMVR